MRSLFITNKLFTQIYCILNSSLNMLRKDKSRQSTLEPLIYSNLYRNQILIGLFQQCYL